MRKIPGGRPWRLRRRADRGQALRRSGSGQDDDQTVAGALQRAIALLTAGLDSPELEEWAVQALIPDDPAALADLLAGMYTVSLLLLYQLKEATRQPPTATLQRLAILAEARRGTSPGG